MIVIAVNEVNAPPLLGFISDRIVDEGTLLSFTVTATDSDLPANGLSFSLDPGAPDGAGIDPDTGLFGWMPPPGHSPVTNLVAVRVTDTGSPPRSHSQTFKVVVVGAPRFRTITVDAAGLVTLTWDAFDGRNYQLQYRDNPASGAWNNLGSETTAVGSVASATDNQGAWLQRFYRVVLLP